MPNGVIWGGRDLEWTIGRQSGYCIWFCWGPDGPRRCDQPSFVKVDDPDRAEDEESYPDRSVQAGLGGADAGKGDEGGRRTCSSPDLEDDLPPAMKARRNIAEGNLARTDL